MNCEHNNHMLLYCLHSDTDIIRTSTNEAYHTVTRTGGGGGGGGEYEMVSIAHSAPTVSSRSSQPTAGDSPYELVQH